MVHQCLGEERFEGYKEGFRAYYFLTKRRDHAVVYYDTNSNFNSDRSLSTLKKHLCELF